MSQHHMLLNQPYPAFTCALALCYFSCILSIVNSDWLQHVCSVNRAYELCAKQVSFKKLVILTAVQWNHIIE